MITATLEIALFIAGYLLLVPVSLYCFFNMFTADSTSIIGAMIAAPLVTWVLSATYFELFEMTKWHATLVWLLILDLFWPLIRAVCANFRILITSRFKCAKCHKAKWEGYITFF
jgi:hypothetical protein